jgi:Zinc-binding loop region of homing endonuclease
MFDCHSQHDLVNMSTLNEHGAGFMATPPTLPGKRGSQLEETMKHSGSTLRGSDVNGSPVFLSSHPDLGGSPIGVDLEESGALFNGGGEGTITNVPKLPPLPIVTNPQCTEGMRAEWEKIAEDFNTPKLLACVPGMKSECVTLTNDVTGKYVTADSYRRRCKTAKGNKNKWISVAEIMLHCYNKGPPPEEKKKKNILHPLCGNKDCLNMNHQIWVSRHGSDERNFCGLIMCTKCKHVFTRAKCPHDPPCSKSRWANARHVLTYKTMQ